MSWISRHRNIFRSYVDKNALVPMQPKQLLYIRSITELITIIYFKLQSDWEVDSQNVCIRIIIEELNKSIAIHFCDYTVYIDLHNSTRKKYDGVVVVYYSSIVFNMYVIRHFYTVSSFRNIIVLS